MNRRHELKEVTIIETDSPDAVKLIKEDRGRDRTQIPGHDWTYSIPAQEHKDLSQAGSNFYKPSVWVERLNSIPETWGALRQAPTLVLQDAPKKDKTIRSQTNLQYILTDKRYPNNQNAWQIDVNHSTIPILCGYEKNASEQVRFNDLLQIYNQNSKGSTNTPRTGYTFFWGNDNISRKVHSTWHSVTWSAATWWVPYCVILTLKSKL